jgi:hypothetical protein
MIEKMEESKRGCAGELGDDVQVECGEWLGVGELK